MRPARGDSRPCSSAGCDGTMRWMRESENDARRPEQLVRAATSAAEDRMGWMCSSEPGHFRYAG